VLRGRPVGLDHEHDPEGDDHVPEIDVVLAFHGGAFVSSE
jgi:hypothetical protein